MARQKAELNRCSNAFDEAVRDGGSSSSIAEASTAFEEQKLKCVQDEIDENLFAKLALASEKLTSIDIHIESAVTTLAQDQQHSLEEVTSPQNQNTDRLLLKITAPQLALEAECVAATSVLNFADEAYGHLVEASNHPDAPPQLALLNIGKPVIDDLIAAQSSGSAASRVDIASLRRVRLELGKSLLELQLLLQVAESLRDKAAQADPEIARVLSSAPVRSLRHWVNQHLKSTVGEESQDAVLRELQRTLTQVEILAGEKVPLLQADVADIHANIGAKVRAGAARKLASELESRTES